MLVSEIRIWHTGTELFCDLHQLGEKHPHAQISWVHLFLPSPEATGMRREMVKCDSAAST